MLSKSLRNINKGFETHFPRDNATKSSKEVFPFQLIRCVHEANERHSCVFKQLLLTCK